ncbi:unnamed protein product [Thlaspi arvense]|uniref:CYC02 protein n=1 Tax=Thlaspi arvense TaxID=13288 RepID=A0AAU9S6S9_THLAR|nr:unnamed protein product [Thlaspi arvense]
MKTLKSLALLALLFSLSLAVFADTSNDATHAKDEVKPSEATDTIEPQQRGGCRYGCCGSYAFGRCSACCSRPQNAEAEPEAEAESKEVVVEPQHAVEANAVEDNAVEPQQRGGGGCRYGCCGWRGGRCAYCCRSPQAETEEAVEAVEPQQRGGGGCRYGCCGWRGRRCTYCCRSPQAETETEEAVEAVEPQQGWGGGGCRYGCCGWRGRRCTYCCRSPQAETEVVEPQQVRRCRYGCCGSYVFGQCSACCSKKMATEEENKKEEAKP